MIEQLDQPVTKLDALTTAEIKTIQDQLAAAKAKQKAREETFAALLERKFTTVAQQAYKDANKDTGVVRVAAPGSNLLELKVDSDKTVVWDQPGTLAWLNKQKPEDARHFGKFKVEIPEAKYSNAPPAVKAELQAFRTVKVGKLKFTIVDRDAAQEAA